MQVPRKRMQGGVGEEDYARGGFVNYYKKRPILSAELERRDDLYRVI